MISTVLRDRTRGRGDEGRGKFWGRARVLHPSKYIRRYTCCPSPHPHFCHLRFCSTHPLFCIHSLPFFDNASFTLDLTSGKDYFTSDQVREDTVPCHSETECHTIASQAKTVVHQHHHLPLPPMIYSICPSYLIVRHIY